MKLYVTRHAETIANKKKINSSLCEDNHWGDLSEKGKKQAEELIEKILPLKISLFIISPLKRTRQTLDPTLNKSNNPHVLVSKLVTERDLGDLTGTKMGEFKKYLDKNKISDKIKWVPPNGESTEQVYQKAKKFLQYLKEKFPDEIIFLCSHRNFIRCLNIVINNEDIYNFNKIALPKNCEIFEFNIK